MRTCLVFRTLTIKKKSFLKLENDETFEARLKIPEKISFLKLEDIFFLFTCRTFQPKQA